MAGKINELIMTHHLRLFLIVLISLVGESSYAQIWMNSGFVIRRHFESCVDFTKISYYDSIVVQNKSGNPEIVFTYKNNQLSTIRYIDSITSRPYAWNNYRYDYLGKLTEIEQKACFGSIECPSIYISYVANYSYDNTGILSQEILSLYHGGRKPVPKLNELKFFKNRLTVSEKTGSNRKTEIKFDHFGRIISKDELDEKNEVICSIMIDYENSKKASITLKILRDFYLEEPVKERIFSLEMTFNKNGTPSTFLESGKVLYFKYYPM